MIVKTSFGTTAHAICSTKCAPARMIPECSASAPTIKPETSWTNNNRRSVTVAVFDKIRRLFGTFGVDDAAEFRRFRRFSFAPFRDDWRLFRPEFRRFAPCRRSFPSRNRLEIRRDSPSSKKQFKTSLHIVRRTMVFGQNFVEFFRRIFRLFAIR